MSSDKPFVLRGGDSEQAATYNRIAVLERINFLTGIDIRVKSAEYLKVLEVAMWKDWLKNEPPDKKVDEEFCQKASEIVKKMEGKPVELNEQEYAQSVGEHKIKLEEQASDNRKFKSNKKDDGKANQPDKD